MKFKKTLTLSVLALSLVGGLAGCSNQPSHHASKPKTEQSAKMTPNEQRGQVATDMQSVKLPKSEQKYSNLVSNGNPYAIGISTKSSKGVDNSQATNNPQQVAKDYWKSIYSQLKKKGDTSKAPITILLTSRKSNGMKNGQPSYAEYAMYSAKSNSPVLHNMHMKKLTSDDEQ